jgi:hypothetical protein
VLDLVPHFFPCTRFCKWLSLFLSVDYESCFPTFSAPLGSILFSDTEYFQDFSSGVDGTKTVWLMPKADMDAIMNSELATPATIVAGKGISIPHALHYESLDGAHRMAAMKEKGYCLSANVVRIITF